MGQTKTFHRKNIRLPRVYYSGRQWYFLTACTQDRVPRFHEPGLVSRQLALLTEQAQKNLIDIIAYCFMPDHLHLLAAGASDDSDGLAFMRTFKQRSGFAFQRSSGESLWQHKFYDHILRSREPWEAVAGYIWMNPVRKGLCASPDEWPFSGSQTVDWKRLLRLPVPSWTPPWSHGR
ncbi:MAG TPA: transposase [Terriglobia bacterium]|nr:transposase [Terriglobia bacterium]